MIKYKNLKFLEDLEHICDLKCVPNLEQVLDNKNVLTILTVLFSNSRSIPFRSFTNRSNIFKNAF